MVKLPTYLHVFVLSCFFFISTTGCVVDSPSADPFTPTITASQTLTLTPTQQTPTQQTPVPSEIPVLSDTPKPTATAIIPDTGWAMLQEGLEKRVIHLLDENHQPLEELHILRIDPDYYQFSVLYQEIPKTLAEWQKITDALILVNGGFFRIEGDTYVPTGLSIVDGKVIGNSYGDYAGMLVITDTGPGLRWMAQEPYIPGEPIKSALQSFPILVKPGGEAGFPVQYEDNHKARRSVIGEDKDGQILLMVAPLGYFTLHQLSLYLAESDLNLELAINLDGGPSSGLWIAEPYEVIPAYSPLPIVIAVHQR